MKIITAAVIKGGTGKTTTAAALIQAAAKDGKRSLAVDLDPQGNLSFTLAGDLTLPGAYDLLHGRNISDTIQTTPQGIDLIASSPDLSTEKTSPGSAKRLEEALSTIKRRYDFIVIDTPPTMGELSYNALQAATGLIIPLEADLYSLQGLYQIVDIADQIKSSNKRLKILGTVVTRYNGRARIRKQLLEIISEKGKEAGAPLLGAIRQGIAVGEAQALQVSLFEYAPKSNPAQDYQTLYKKIMEG